jgi:hypothetical protein
VSLVLRPEMVWIAEGDGRLEDLVRRSLYLGDAVEYDVEVQGQLLTFTATNPLRMRVHLLGSRVPLDFHAEMVHRCRRVEPRPGPEVAERGGLPRPCVVA